MDAMEASDAQTSSGPRRAMFENGPARQALARPSGRAGRDLRARDRGPGSSWPRLKIGALALIGLFVAGYFFWTLSEYWIHRVMFHFEPEEGFGARLHWIIHGVHHDHPNDPMRLVMPPSVERPAVVAVLPRLLGRARHA